VLAQVRVEIKRGSIRYIASGVVRNNGNVVTYLALVRIAFEGVKRIAHRHISRPANTSVRAIRVEQLRIGVIRRIARIVPNSVKASVGRDRKCAKPMPLTGIDRIIVDLVRRAEG
jgi:hypothetical protein